MPSRGDFHCHSTASDGARSPSEVVKLAYEQGVRVLALTDHDSTEGVAEARRAGSVYPDFTLIPGVEMGTDIPSAEVHVLGYYLEPDNAELQATLARLRESRKGRGEGIVIKLREMGLDVTWEQVQRIAGDASVGRPHVAQALLESGHVSTIKEAFDKYIGRNGPAYVEREKMTPAEAVREILRLGGKATALFPTEAERTALARTPEYKRVLALLDGLPPPAVQDFAELLATANGAISVRLPRSVHAALLAEAKAEGVSLNQLCLSKLVAQLRAVV